MTGRRLIKTHHPFTPFPNYHSPVFISTDRQLDFTVLLGVICPPPSSVPIHHPAILSPFSVGSVDILTDNLLSFRETVLIAGCVCPFHHRTHSVFLHSRWTSRRRLKTQCEILTPEHLGLHVSPEIK